MFNDLRYAFRQLLKNPGFTAVAVLTLALGIGANTATFSQINELLLRPLPVKEPQELMALVLIDQQGDYSNQNIPYPVCRDYREQSRALSELIAYAKTIHSPWQSGDKTTAAFVQLVSANFFSALGVVPALGRDFLLDEDQHDLHLQATMDSRDPVSSIEIIQNGCVAQTVPYSEWKRTGALGVIRFKESGWFLVRAVADVPSTFRFASTGPFYVEVGPASRRVSKTSAGFFVDWVREWMNQIKLDNSRHRDEVLQYHRAAEQFWRLKVAEANAD